MELKRRLTVRLHFDAAHYLRGYQGKCSHIHGHRWDVVFVFTATSLDGYDDSGMIVDFKKLRETLETVLPDHQFLNSDVEQFKEENPTAEAICAWLFLRVSHLINQGQGAWADFKEIFLQKVEVYESQDCSASVEV